jgi:hypothetical protein
MVGALKLLVAQTIPPAAAKNKLLDPPPAQRYKQLPLVHIELYPELLVSIIILAWVPL